MADKKTYTVETNKRTSKPRSQRLRDLGLSGDALKVELQSSADKSTGNVATDPNSHKHLNKDLLDSLSRDNEGYLYMDPSSTTGTESGTTGTESGTTTDEDPSRVKVNSGEADKIKDDTYKEILHTLKGIDSGNFEANSTGIGIYKDEDGNWHIDADFFNVRKKLTAKEIEVQHWSHVGGVLAVTSAGMIVKSVETAATYYRCYFETTDADGRTVYNLFSAGDGAYCETFNLTQQADGTLGNHYFWRRVVAVGDNYIDISIADCGSGSDAPKVGDSIEQLGNSTNTDRQGAIIIAALGTGAPCIKIYDGITGFTLPEPLTKLGPKGNKITGEFVSSVTGKKIDDTLNALSTGLEEVTQQADRSWVLWIETEEPTLSNAPAVDWTTDALKDEHVKDIVMIKDNSTAKKNGRAWRFTKTTATDGSSTYSWDEITDQYLLDALMLANAKKRTFVAQPGDDSEYDVGDMWTNATWMNADGTYLYDNDTLVCNTAKAKGASFSISHWSAATKYTSALIKSEDDRVLLAATTAATNAQNLAAQANAAADSAYSQATSAYNKAVSAYNKATSAQDDADSNYQSIAALRVDVNSVTAVAQKISFDSNNKITNIDRTGLVLTSDFASLMASNWSASGISSSAGLVVSSGSGGNSFASLFASVASDKGYKTEAEIITNINNGVSSISLTADKVSIGSAKISDLFTISSWGTTDSLMYFNACRYQFAATSGNGVTVAGANFDIYMGGSLGYGIMIGKNNASEIQSMQMFGYGLFITRGSSSMQVQLDSSGKASIRATNGFPTSKTGLSTGTIWSDGGTLKVV